MDEIPSFSRKDCNGRVDGEKVKKKKKRSKTTEQHELTESPQEQTEKRRKKKDKRKNSKTESDDNLQTHTGKKKKRRKLDNEGETSVLDDGVSNQHEAQTQELQGSRKEKTSRRKKKREKLKQTNREDMTKEQTDIRTEHEEEPNTRDEESDPPDVIITAEKRESKTQKNQLDSKFLEELKELCPKIKLESQSKSYIKDIIRYDLSRFKEFRKQGIQMRDGRFSTAENERLKLNVSNFLALTGVKDAVRLFFPCRYPKEATALRKLKKQHRFFERIADGIPRFCGDVYDRGAKVYDDRNYKGTFTKEEEKLLLKYYKRYGRNWQKISDKTRRNCRALEYRLSLIDKRRGPWRSKEVQRLLRAVRDHILSVLKSENPNQRKPKRVDRKILYKNLPWTRIGETVKTRCWISCKSKWMSILSARMSSGTTFKGRKAQEAKIKLIKAMYELQVEDAVDIPWEDLTAVSGDVLPSNVQSRWHQLKVSYVPDWKNKCFADTVDFLYENVLPGMMKECEDLDDDDDDDDKLKVDQMKSFRLADIFQDINEDECCDSDEETVQQEKNSSA
ncbi:transcription termination factor 1 [Danio aesculapii]|uniref:transcription termination factor 1 n=1 Tax=Danio aesculapii TaxID=1142201 RepID=UPI0024C05E8F|nr:transcription termination factor 1 [Danio aesculapii]